MFRTLSWRNEQLPDNLKISVSEVYPGVGAKLFFMEYTMMHNGKLYKRALSSVKLFENL